MDKSPFKSVTLWGAVAMAALQVLESQGAIPAGSQNGVVAFLAAAAQLVTIFGLRKAIG